MPKKTNNSRRAVPKVGQHSFCRWYCPDEQFVTLRYAGSATASATGSYYLYQFRGNSPYDPDYTSTGAQPVGYDLWSALYSRYRVYECTMKVKLTSGDTGGNVRCAVWATPGGPSGAPSAPSYDDAAGNRFSVKTSAAAGGPTSTVSMTTDVARLWGTERGAVEFDDNFASGVATSPNRLCWLSLVFDTSSSTGTFTYEWELTMKTRFYQPLGLGLSATRRGVAVTSRPDAEVHRCEREIRASAEPVEAGPAPQPVEARMKTETVREDNACVCRWCSQRL